MHLSLPITTLIADAKLERNTLKLLTYKSKQPKDVELRAEIASLSNFLPAKASIRERLWHIEHQTQSPPKCSHCNIVSVKWDSTTQRFRDYCGSHCGGIAVDVQTRRQATNVANMGVAFPAQHKISREKYKNTMIERYGAPYINQSDLINRGIYDQLSYSSLHEMTHVDGLSTFDIADNLLISQSMVSRCMNEKGVLARPKSQSSFQRQIVDVINNVYSGTMITNDRSMIKPLEIDILLPELRIGIEIDGLYWHTEVSGKKQSNYHINKTMLAANAGIKLIHIFESDWIHHKDAIVSRLTYLCKQSVRIHARKTEVCEITSYEASKFYQLNHIQGRIGSKIHLGLMYEGHLVSCMSFTPSRFSKKYQYELTRFSSKGSFNVVGGASKLLAYFVRTYNPTSIVSYCDLRWGTGGVYQQLGFILSHRSKPNYWYVANGSKILQSRIIFQKHKMDRILKLFDPLLTEWENMQANMYDRIWDCGNDVWVLTL